MSTLFSDLPEALENNFNLPFKCNFRPQFSKPILPNISTEKGGSADEILKKNSLDGLKDKPITEEELNIILDEFCLIEDKALIDQKRGSHSINSSDSRKRNSLKINGFICERANFILKVRPKNLVFGWVF